jgi:hypothetical protein
MSITTKIITRQQIQLYKQISSSIYDAKLNQIILETQFQDLRPLIGERFFNDILQKESESSNIYDDLLDGNTYVYQGITYSNYGLRCVLANYIYARYTMFGDVIDNSFGQTLKLNGNESQPLSGSLKKSLYQMNRDLAYNYWLNVRDFIIRNNNDFLLYNDCYTSDNKTFKLSKIG